MIVHDKSSLAPEGSSLAFSLENGFQWLDGFGEITAAQLLSGGTADGKTEQARQLILDMLSDGKAVPCNDILAAALQKQISERTVKEAKKNIGTVRSRRDGNGWVWYLEP